MSDKPEALIEKVAWAMREASELTMSETRPMAVVALDTLGLREELLAGRETIDGYDTTPWVRYVTEWEER